MKLIANNKKAYHEYSVLDTLEAGIVLCGTEVKSLRQNGCSFNNAYISIDKGEAFLLGIHIKPYEQGNIWNEDPDRVRKLLLHKKEILRLAGDISEKGMTLIPLEIYFTKSHVKVKIGLCKGKKLYDKREDARKKDIARESERDYKVSIR